RVERVEGDPFTAATGAADARCDADGLVRLDSASWSTSCARVEEAGYAPGFRMIESGHEQPSAPCTVLLYRAATLDVTVDDGRGGARAGLALRLECSAWDRIEGSSWRLGREDPLLWEAHTDAGGRCVIADLPARTALTLELRDGERVARRDERGL